MTQIVTCNAGSSGIKLAAFDGVTLALQEKFQVEQVSQAVAWLEARNVSELRAVGHRVVHGGRDFAAPVAVTEKILAGLDALTPLAPLHQPNSLEAIRALHTRFPALPQIACFDTAFHHTLPEIERRFALPEAWHVRGVQRYGFHGLSYEYIASVLPEFAGTHSHGRTVVAHLGNGASVCGMVNLKSRATSMGFSTLDGLMMGTRCGALDAGVVLYLLEEAKLSAAEVAHLLYHDCGLKGVSGHSQDVRVLLASDTSAAKEALALFALSAAKHIAEIAVSLGGMDVLVFTGGIGEHAVPVRAMIAKHLEFLGVALSPPQNAAQGPKINASSSSVDVFVIPTNEEIVIARACRAVTV